MPDIDVSGKLGLPGQQIPDIREWETTASYVIEGQTTTPTVGAGSTFYRRTTRDNEYAIIRWEFSQTVAGTAGSGLYLLPMPTGLTINFAKLNVAGASNTASADVGRGWLLATNNYQAALFATTGIAPGYIAVALQDTATTQSGWGSTLAPLTTATVRFSLEARVPILQWANQSLNTQPASLPVYASNSSTTTASDSTSFQYDENGALIQAFNPSASGSVTKRIRSPYPNPKFPFIQLKLANRNWIPLGNSYHQRTTNDAGTSFYGMWIQPVSGSTTDFDVVFHQSCDPAGNTWAAENTSGTRWRVVFSDTPIQINYGQATDLVPGLISREQTSLLTTPINGATTSPNVTVRQTRNGRMINLTISNIGPLVKNGSSGTFFFTIDSDYRPTANIRTITYAYVNNTLQGVLWIINANGVIEVFSNSAGTPFASGSINNGWDGDITLTYSIR